MKGKRRRAPGLREREYFYGYKTHVSLNARTELITSLTVTPGAAYDGHQLPALVDQDLAQGLPVGVYAGDRGYDDGENHAFLAARGLKSALRLNAYRTQKKDGNKEPWLRLLADPDYQRSLQQPRKAGEVRRGQSSPRPEAVPLCEPGAVPSTGLPDGLGAEPETAGEAPLWGGLSGAGCSRAPGSLA